MAFPNSPVDGQLYTTSLGTQYRYNLADTAWKIVGGASTASGVVGPGTIGTLAMFTPDTTSIGDSVLRQDTGNLFTTGSLDSDSSIIARAGVSLLNELNVQAQTGTTSIATVTSDASTKISISAVKSLNSIGNDLIVRNFAAGGDYNPGSTEGPDGISVDNGVGISTEGADWFMLDTYGTSTVLHQAINHVTKFTIDNNTTTIKTDATIVNGALKISNQNGGPVMIPFAGNKINVGNTFDNDWSRDGTYGMLNLADAGTLAADGTVNVLVGDTNAVIFTGLLYIDGNAATGGSNNGGGALLNIGTDVCGIIVNVIGQWGSFVTPPDSTTNCINFAHVAAGVLTKQRLQIINRYADPARIRYWFVGGRNGLA